MPDSRAIRDRAQRLSADPRVARAVERLRAGAIVAFPTETVFALAADGMREDAVQRLSALKGRPADKPMPLLVADAAMAERVGVVDVRARAAMDALWPGPITLVVPARKGVPAIVRAGGETVGVRCPAHPLALAIVQGFGGPLAAPSANRSDEPPATTAAQARAALPSGAVLIVNDEPPGPAGASSTVAALGASAGEERILRQGPITLEELAAAARLP